MTTTFAEQSTKPWTRMQMSSLRLHDAKGVNPRLMICPQCGEDTGVALIGAHESKTQCSDCGTICYGGYPRGPGNRRCQKPGCFGTYHRIGAIEEREKIPGDLCDKCADLNKQVAEVVTQGGIHFHCEDCGAAGAIRPDHPLSIAVRKQMGIEAPNPCGIELTKKECPQCHE